MFLPSTCQRAELGLSACRTSENPDPHIHNCPSKRPCYALPSLQIKTAGKVVLASSVILPNPYASTSRQHSIPSANAMRHCLQPLRLKNTTSILTKLIALPCSLALCPGGN